MSGSNPKPLVHHLYVHIPFCTHICPYCAFYKTRNSLPEIKAFLPALLRELAWARENFDLRPSTIFWGGGTPSALSIPQLEEIFSHWPWGEVTEFTLEANPLTISPAKADLLRQAGVNRISLGAQAFDEASLKILGRTHRESDIVKSVEILRRAGFQNLNLDLMFALPGQTTEAWQYSLAQAVALSPEHLSAYNLTYEEDTDFFQKLQAGLWNVNEERDRNFFLHGTDFLASRGFEAYEISNFARPGFASIHNQAYWQGHDYLGLGPGACSTVGGQRWQNASDTRRYAEGLLRDGEAPRQIEELTAETRRTERILLQLRTSQGVESGLLKNQKELLTSLQQEGLIELSPDRVRLTAKGRVVADSVTELLI